MDSRNKKSSFKLKVIWKGCKIWKSDSLTWSQIPHVAYGVFFSGAEEMGSYLKRFYWKSQTHTWTMQPSNLLWAHFSLLQSWARLIIPKASGKKNCLQILLLQLIEIMSISVFPLPKGTNVAGALRSRLSNRKAQNSSTLDPSLDPIYLI